MRRSGRLRQFNRPDSAYTDDAGDSANTKPAIDFTATALLALPLPMINPESPVRARGRPGRSPARTCIDVDRISPVSDDWAAVEADTGGVESSTPTGAASD